MTNPLSMCPDCDLIGAQDGDSLVYNGTTRKWRPTGLAGLVVQSNVNAPDSIKQDGVIVSALKWITVTVTAALLDSAGAVAVLAGVAGDQYKLRHIRLIGGGANFDAGGNRLISLTDGTTVWTTIANADIETAPAATLDWGNAKVPFLTNKSDVASVAGQDIRFQYSGGTTDHGGIGSIKFDVCLEKVA